ncbi:MAG: phenylalanine--tRNA ligase subunit beta [Candidatus Atribacteria bacterium]|nr:phenylalanine--tRNA ligase subunit beta [Candidatus Atribacteria bacterium]
MRIAYSILKRFLRGLDVPPQELATLLIEQGLVVERMAHVEDIFAFPLYAGTLEEAKKGFLYSECLVKMKEKTFPVRVKNWGVPQPGTRVLISLREGTPSFSLVAGEEKEVLEFLIALPDVFPEGEDISRFLFERDTVMDLEITPNRGDCLSIVGIVRDLSAKLDLDWEEPGVAYQEVEIPSPLTLRDEDFDLCPYYTGKFIANVTVKPSSWEIVRDLYLLGLRPINNVVDITNLVMMEIGQPLHAFDASCIKDNLVVVRRAKAGERIITIDGLQRELSGEMLVIADGRSPIGIAGIMGGQNTEVSPTTREVFLESAFFNRVSIRRTSRALGLRTEASARFERGVDPQRVRYASERVLSLLSQEGGIQIAKEWAIAGEPPCLERTVRVFPEKINEILSCQVETERMIRILERLGFTVAARTERDFTVKVPSFRADVAAMVDIAEEVGRINGYEQIRLSSPGFPFDPGDAEKNYALEQRLRTFLVSRGLKEAVTLSFVDPKTVQELEIEAEQLVAIKNPLSQDQSFLRSQILLSLLGVLRLNLGRGRNHFGLFEVGKVFYPSKEVENPWKEELRLGMVLCGYLLPLLWQKGAQVDFFVLKGLVEEILEVIGVSLGGVRFLPWDDRIPGFEKNVAFVLSSSGGDLLGWGGKLSERTLWRLDMRGELYYLELRLEEIFGLVKDVIPAIKGANLFPAIVRDISVVVDRSLSWNAMKEKIDEVIAKEEMTVESVEVFDIFEGKPLPREKKGLSFRCIFRSLERTLNDEEVDVWVQKIKENIKKMRGVHLREEFVHP